MSMTKFEAHDGSAEPTRQERLMEAVIQDIEDNESASIDAVQGFIQDDEIRESFKMVLVNAIDAIGTANEVRAQERLGNYVMWHVINSIKEEL